MKEVKIKKVDIKSVFKISIIILTGIGLISDIIIKIAGMFSIPAPSSGVADTYIYQITGHPVYQNFGNSFIAAILNPLHFTILGIILSVFITLTALSFNLICKLVGGINIYIKE